MSAIFLRAMPPPRRLSNDERRRSYRFEGSDAMTVYGAVPWADARLDHPHLFRDGLAQPPGDGGPVPRRERMELAVLVGLRGQGPQGCPRSSRARDPRGRPRRDLRPEP